LKSNLSVLAGNLPLPGQYPFVPGFLVFEKKKAEQAVWPKNLVFVAALGGS